MKPQQLKIHWNTIVFVRLTLFLTLGIAFHIQAPFPIPHAFAILTLVSVFYIFLTWFSSKKIKRIYKPLFGITAFIILFLFGYCLTETRTEGRQSNHIIHTTPVEYYKGQIISDIQYKAKSKKVIFQVNAFYKDSSWLASRGKVLLYFSNTDSSYIPKYGDQLLIKGAPSLLSVPANPNEFDYKRYLSFQNIYHQQFLRKGDYSFLSHQFPNPLLAFALKVRKSADAIFRKYLTSDQAYGIATALVLGVKDHLDSSIKQAYSSAGAMHVLAVSGLHVGIIFKLLGFLLGRLKKKRWSNVLFVLLSLLTLWLYALITGFSPSVLRAVTMFSFLIIASGINRQVNIYNTLALSAFVLLCWNPYLIMGVGFLLSYVAVIGIVYLQPKFASLLFIRNRFLRFLWEITCVSVAAQMATFPIGLLFFHQFPTYFWVSNFFVIPAATLILQLGLGLLLFGSIYDWLGQKIGWLLNQLIKLLNEIVYAIQHLPHALIQGVDISILEAWLIYFSILGILLLFAIRNLRFLYFTIFIIGLFVFKQFEEITEHKQQKALVVYHINRQSNLCLINGDQAFFLADSTLLEQKDKLNFHVKHHFWKLGVIDEHWLDWKRNDGDSLIVTKSIHSNRLIVWENKKILYYTTPVMGMDINVDYLIIGNNAVKEWKDLSSIQAQTVILDANNAKSVIKKLVQSKNELSRNVNLYDVKNDGAFFSSLIPSQ